LQGECDKPNETRHSDNIINHKFHPSPDIMIRKCGEHGYFRGEECPQCGERGKFMLDDEHEMRLGRFVSGVLRHFPDDVGLDMDAQGWIELDAFCEAMKKRYKWAGKMRLVSLVESDPKQRYEIDDSFIRARYGHSIDVNLDYPLYDSDVLYYGVSQEEVDMLLENGIKPYRQTYIHLSTTSQQARQAAAVHTDNPVILGIDAASAAKDGYEFLCANDEIVLSKEVLPEYIEVADE